MKLYGRIERRVDKKLRDFVSGFISRSLATPQPDLLGQLSDDQSQVKLPNGQYKTAIISGTPSTYNQAVKVGDGSSYLVVEELPKTHTISGGDSGLVVLGTVKSVSGQPKPRIFIKELSSNNQYEIPEAFINGGTPLNIFNGSSSNYSNSGRYYAALNVAGDKLVIVRVAHKYAIYDSGVDIGGAVRSSSDDLHTIYWAIIENFSFTPPISGQEPLGALTFTTGDVTEGSYSFSYLSLGLALRDTSRMGMASDYSSHVEIPDGCGVGNPTCGPTEIDDSVVGVGFYGLSHTLQLDVEPKITFSTAGELIIDVGGVYRDTLSARFVRFGTSTVFIPACPAVCIGSGGTLCCFDGGESISGYGATAPQLDYLTGVFQIRDVTTTPVFSSAPQIPTVDNAAPTQTGTIIVITTNPNPATMSMRILLETGINAPVPSSTSPSIQTREERTTYFVDPSLRQSLSWQNIYVANRERYTSTPDTGLFLMAVHNNAHLFASPLPNYLLFKNLSIFTTFSNDDAFRQGELDEAGFYEKIAAWDRTSPRFLVMFAEKLHEFLELQQPDPLTSSSSTWKLVQWVVDPMLLPGNPSYILPTTLFEGITGDLWTTEYYTTPSTTLQSIAMHFLHKE